MSLFQKKDKDYSKRQSIETLGKILDLYHKFDRNIAHYQSNEQDLIDLVNKLPDDGDSMDEALAKLYSNYNNCFIHIDVYITRSELYINSLDYMYTLVIRPSLEKKLLEIENYSSKIRDKMKGIEGKMLERMAEKTHKRYSNLGLR